MRLLLLFMVLVRVTVSFLLQQRKGVREKRSSMQMCLIPCLGCRKLQNSQEDGTKDCFF